MAKKDFSKKALALHKKLGGKITVSSTVQVRNRSTLSLVYTPGVAAVSSLIARSKRKAQAAVASDYTIKSKTVAVISDG